MRENHINSKEKIKIWFSRLWIIIYILTFVIYIVKPICFDVKIYLEAARRANNLREFPHNIFQAWEHKYILNRLLFYMIFKITSLVISPNNIMLFELTIKTIYGILAIVIIKCFSKSTKSFFEKYKIREPIVFGVLYISIIGSNIYFTMQTEMTAFLITLIAIIFILKDKLIYKLISAFIISTLFWFKGVTLLNAIIILIVMLIDKHPKKEIVFVICWSWIFLLSEILLVNYIEPNEIKNMYLSTQYLNNFNITKKIADYFTTLSSYSLLWIGLLVYIINFIYHIRTKNIKLLVLESLTWIILLLGVYIQKLNYFYQIGLVISGILFSIFIFLYYMNMHREYQKKWDVILFFIMIFIILIVTTINIGYEIISTRKIYKNTIESIEQLKILEYEIPDLKEEEVLYIGNGLASYYIKANSYIDYTTTIYFNNYNEVYKNSQYIKDLKAKVKNYKGKYIVVDKIEFTTKFRISDDIAKLIEENYHYKQNTNISIYENPAKNNNEYIVIYEKNN